jgi:hypothetical protein
MIPWLKTWSSILTYVNIRWEKPEQEKIKYWDLGEVKPLTWIRFSRYNLQGLMHKVQSNYSSCIVRNSENICSSSGAVPKKAKTRWNSICYKKKWFVVSPLALSPHPPLPPSMVVYLFCKFFQFLTQFMTKLRVQVLCFLCFTNKFTDN